MTQRAVAERSRSGESDAVEDERADQQEERPKHGCSNHAQQDVAKHLVQRKGSAHAGDDHRDHEHENYRQQKPGGPKG